MNNTKNLTKIIRGIPVEEFIPFIQKEETLIYEKYQMIGNPLAEAYVRSIGKTNTSSPEMCDNHLREYFVKENIVALFSDRRNDFNTVDLYVMDIGETAITGADEIEI